MTVPCGIARSRCGSTGGLRGRAAGIPGRQGSRQCRAPSQTPRSSRRPPTSTRPALHGASSPRAGCGSRRPRGHPTLVWRDCGTPQEETGASRGERLRRSAPPRSIDRHLLKRPSPMPRASCRFPGHNRLANRPWAAPARRLRRARKDRDNILRGGARAVRAHRSCQAVRLHRRELCRAAGTVVWRR